MSKKTPHKHLRQPCHDQNPIDTFNAQACAEGQWPPPLIFGVKLSTSILGLTLEQFATAVRPETALQTSKCPT